MALRKNTTPLAPKQEEVSPVPNLAEKDTNTRPDYATERLNLAVELVKKKFNLSEGYCIVKFSDKGKVVDLTLDGSDFIVSVTIKNSEMHGMYIPPTPALPPSDLRERSSYRGNQEQVVEEIVADTGRRQHHRDER